MAEEILFTISSENDAFALLEEMKQRGLSDRDAKPKIVWNKWPTIDIHLPNTPAEGSISPTMMAAFLELQKTIYRTHSLLSSGTSNLRTLSRIEREELEFTVKVKKGSSGYSIDLNEIISKLGNEVVSKMSGTELVITVIALALILGGHQAYRAYLNQKTEQKKIESEDSGTKQLLENHQAQLAHDTKRYEMLTSALVSKPILREIEAETNRSRDEILKAVAEEGGGQVMGVDLPKDFANEISSTTRRQSKDVNLAGKYRIAKVDTTIADGFRVTLEDTETGEEITASLLDAMVSSAHRTALQKAEWSKVPVFVEMKARRLRGRIIDAVVIGVREVTAADA